MKVHPVPWVSALMALLPLGIAAAGKSLNQISVHYQYNDGDFPAVITAIDEFTRAHKTYSRADSIFIAKHLAVVYTANPDTREKGKYYMYQMLDRACPPSRGTPGKPCCPWATPPKPSPCPRFRPRAIAGPNIP